MKRAEWDHAYQSREHVKERDTDNKRNTCHSTKTAQQAVPVDVSAKIASLQMKRAIIYRRYNSKEHVKEKRVENKRNTCHSTKAAQQAADVDGVIEATSNK